MSEDNLKLWESVEKTNPAHTKKVSSGGHSFTAIDAYHQIKNATKLWGAYGGKWGFEKCHMEMIHSGEDVMALFAGTFKYPEGSFPISSSITVKYMTSNKYIKIDGEFAKKVETDAITKALSRLGFNADVFLGRFDDNRYIQEMKKEFAESKEPQRNWIAEIKTASTEEELKSIFGVAYKSTEGEEKAKIKLEYDKKKTEITELGGSSQAQR
ncbi:hypothetical protein KAR91_02030 [Candidatus Pacearchaeota archaeon]|nr:hypothetical protein [Candidatus Pacearchaeota archaeon]